MNMNIQVLVKVLFQSKELGPGADIRHCRLGRFLHDLSQLARDGKLSLARKDRHFNIEQLAPNFGPRQAGNNTDRVFFFGCSDFISLL